MSNQPSFEIRFLQASETQRLTELIKGLHVYQKMNGRAKVPSAGDIVRDLFHEDDSGDIVPQNLGTFPVIAVDLSKTEVNDHSNIVGYMMYTVKFNLMQGRQFYICSFFIEEPYRRHGLGRKFIKFMQTHAELLGIDTFDVPCINTNFVALNFYLSMGARSVDEEYDVMAAPPNF